MLRYQRLLLVLVMVCAVILAACGGDEDPTATTEPTEVPTEEPTEAPTEEPTEEEPTEEPTEEEPTEAPTEEEPTEEPTEEEPTEEPTEVVEVPGTVLETASETSDFSVLVAAIEAAGLEDALSEDGPFTVFAPTNDAFAAALEALEMDQDALLEDTETLTNILLYHVVEGAVLAEDVAGMDGESVATLLEGAELSISVTDDGVVLNDSVNVVTTDIEASNGVIHVIDAVLLPPTDEETMDTSEMATEEPTEEVMETEEPTEEAMDDASDEEDEDTASTGGLITSVCLVTDQGGINDGTFNQLAFEGMNRAADSFGLETQAIESDTPSDFEPNITSCLDSDFDAIVTVGFLLADATLEAAEANPDVYFIGVDQFFEAPPENLVGLQFREDQSGFLAGVMAGMMTESGTVGGVYGQEIPPVIKFRHGFEQGVAYANPDVETLGVYIDSFVDPARGAETAEQLIGQGADIIFGAGGQTGSGGIQFAAAEADVLVIGVDQDEYFTTFGGGESPGAENLITSAIKRVDQAVFVMLDALTEGNYEWGGGGLFSMDASNDGIGVTEPHDADVPQEVLDAVDEAFEMLKSGELTTGVDPVTGAMLEDDE